MAGRGGPVQREPIRWVLIEAPDQTPKKDQVRLRRRVVVTGREKTRRTAEWWHRFVESC